MLFLAPHNVAAAKLARLTDGGANVAVSTFYTESATDMPSAAAAGKTFIFNAGIRSRRRLPAATSNKETLRQPITEPLRQRPHVQRNPR